MNELAMNARGDEWVWGGADTEQDGCILLTCDQLAVQPAASHNQQTSLNMNANRTTLNIDVTW